MENNKSGRAKLNSLKPTCVDIRDVEAVEYYFLPFSDPYKVIPFRVCFCFQLLSSKCFRFQHLSSKCFRFFKNLTAFA